MKDYELKMTQFKAEMNNYNATFEHPLIMFLIDAMVKAFKSIEGAENYVCLTYAAEGELWEVTI